MTPVAERTSAPAPCESTSGTVPAMKATEVITIGRNRSRQASSAASHNALSCSSSSREFDDQNGVLARQPHQHHQADLHEGIVVTSGEFDARERAEHAHGHDKDHRQRQGPGLVQRGGTRKASRMATGKTSRAALPCDAS